MYIPNHAIEKTGCNYELQLMQKGNFAIRKQVINLDLANFDISGEHEIYL